jgi:CHAT domain-containing protein
LIFILLKEKSIDSDSFDTITLAEPLIPASATIVGKESFYTAVLAQYLATLYRIQGNPDKAETLYFYALMILETLPGDNHEQIIALLNSLALMYMEQGRYSSSEEVYLKLLAIKELQYGKVHLVVAETLSDLAFCYQSMQNWGQAQAMYLRALSILQASVKPDQRFIAATLNNLARIYKQQGKYADAETHYLRALNLLKTSLGSDHPDVAAMQNNLAGLYLNQGHYDKALPLYQQTLAIKEQAYGRDHPDIALTLNSLAVLYMDVGDFVTALAMYQRAVSVQEKALGKESLELSATLSNLGGLFLSLQQFTEAEQLYQRALGIRENALGPDHSEVATVLNNLGTLYEQQALHAKAESLFQRALAIQEKQLGRNHPDVAATLNNLAALYKYQEIYVRAEPLLKRALSIKETMLGSKHPSLTPALANLAGIYFEQGLYDEAEKLFQRALEINAQALGKDSPAAASMLNSLAAVYEAQGEYALAEPMFQRSLAIYKQLYGDNHYRVAVIINNLAGLYAEQGDGSKAEVYYQRALKMAQEAFGEMHPDVAMKFDNLGYLYLNQGQMKKALLMFRKSTAIHTQRQMEAVLEPAPRKAEEIAQHQHAFRYHLQTAWAVASADQQLFPELASESYLISQWLNQTDAEAALAQMSVRFSAGSDSLAVAVRQYQDRLQAYKSIDDAYIKMFAESDETTDTEKLGQLRQKRRILSDAVTAQGEKLQAMFPEYVQLASPQPLRETDVRDLLKKKEGILHFSFGNETSLVFLVTQEEFLWRLIDIDRLQLRRQVKALRSSLDPNIRQPSGEGVSPQQAVQFDLDLAHQLYQQLIGPVESGLQDIDHLYFVPSDALTSLPPSVLVTDPPKRRSGMRANTDAAWLIKRHAVTVLPSVSSLRALRRFAAKDQAGRPFAGIGNPLFKEQQADLDTRQRGVAAYFDGQLANITSLHSLGNLPQTETEIRQLAAILNAGEDDLYLREAANETAIKQAPLDRYQIINFATHGLLAGELDGQAEPGLVLTPPQVATQENDGLLTASEVARMRFNADWVILSACNTAAGDSPGADGLSGLARAFFYAGARTLLVSHWPVGDRAAVKLTTAAVEYLKEHPGAGKSEAFRQSMLQLIQDRSNPWNAHPRTWAPFVVVGEN